MRSIIRAYLLPHFNRLGRKHCKHMSKRQSPGVHMQELPLTPPTSQLDLLDAVACAAGARIAESQLPPYLSEEDLRLLLTPPDNPSQSSPFLSFEPQNSSRHDATPIRRISLNPNGISASRDPFNCLPGDVNTKTWRLLDRYLDAASVPSTLPDMQLQVQQMRKNVWLPMILESKATYNSFSV